MALFTNSGREVEEDHPRQDRDSTLDIGFLVRLQLGLDQAGFGISIQDTRARHHRALAAAFLRVVLARTAGVRRGHAQRPQAQVGA